MRIVIQMYNNDNPLYIHTQEHSLCLNFIHLLARKPNLEKKIGRTVLDT